MSVHVISVSVAKRIEQLQRDFLWGTGGGEGSHYHLMAWDRICRPKVQGGLGIRRLVLFNVALLGKWLWRFVAEQDRFWRRVVAAKFGVGHGGWCSGRVGHSHGHGLWKGIWLGWEEIGDRVRFWRDRWCGDLTLEKRFPLVLLVELLAFLYELRVGEVGWDSLVWKCPGAKGTFSVFSYYEVCLVPGTPSKVAFFV
ncbi:hypothetical protein CsSME_00037813 [Camellia sinensis var. sinensis]